MYHHQSSSIPARPTIFQRTWSILQERLNTVSYVQTSRQRPTDVLSEGRAQLLDMAYLEAPAVHVKVCVPVGVALDHSHLPPDDFRR